MNDTRPILIVQNCEIESPGLIRSVLESVQQPYDLIQNWRGDNLPPLGNYKGMINLGCPESANDHTRYPFLGAAYKAVEEALKHEMPYLGICCGGQILSLALGGTVTRNHTKEIGSYTVRKTENAKNDPWFATLPDQFPVFHWHGESFSIPEGAQLLVTGDDCVNQAFRHRNAVGIQFHLEADPNEIPAWCDRYSDELDEVGKSSDEIIQAHANLVDEIQNLNRQLLGRFLADADAYDSK